MGAGCWRPPLSSPEGLGPAPVMPSTPWRGAVGGKGIGHQRLGGLLPWVLRPCAQLFRTLGTPV